MGQASKRTVLTWFFVAFFIIVVGSVFLFSEHLISLFDNPSKLRLITINYPILGPLLIIGLIIAEVVIAPLPGGFLPIVTGFLFGFWLGTFYSWTGNVGGAAIAWGLAHFLGRPFIKHFVKEEKIRYYDTFIIRRQVLIWFLYIIPLFPIDVISFSMGLSRISFKKFIFIAAIALLPNMFLLNLLGDYIYNSEIVYFLWLIGVIILLFLMYAFLKERKRNIFHDRV